MPRLDAFEWSLITYIVIAGCLNVKKANDMAFTSLNSKLVFFDLGALIGALAFAIIFALPFITLVHFQKPKNIPPIKFTILVLTALTSTAIAF